MFRGGGHERRVSRVCRYGNGLHRYPFASTWKAKSELWLAALGTSPEGLTQGCAVWRAVTGSG